MTAGVPSVDSSCISVSLVVQCSVWTRAVVAQHPRHIVVVFRGRRDPGNDPIEQIGIVAIEQSFESVELGAVEVRERPLGERTENEVAFLRAAMPASEQQPPAPDIW